MTVVYGPVNDERLDSSGDVLIEILDAGGRGLSTSIVPTVPGTTGGMVRVEYVAPV